MLGYTTNVIHHTAQSPTNYASFASTPDIEIFSNFACRAFFSKALLQSNPSSSGSTPSVGLNEAGQLRNVEASGTGNFDHVTFPKAIAFDTWF